MKALLLAYTLLFAAVGTAHAQQRVNTATGVLTYPSTLGTGQYLTPWTVASLASGRPCTAALAGSTAYVTDATAPTYGAALTGGSNVGTRVLCSCTGGSCAWVSE